MCCNFVVEPQVDVEWRPHEGKRAGKGIQLRIDAVYTPEAISTPNARPISVSIGGSGRDAAIEPNNAAIEPNSASLP
jgi:hypothetical protein